MSAGMGRKGCRMLLFLDTPRAGDGLNHRYFVASPPNCDEEEIVRYARQARANQNGPDYLAAARPVSQISRGQTRTGLELLVFAGIATGDAAQNTRMRARLDSMLDSLHEAPVAIEDGGVGLLMPSRQIAEFQSELRAEAVPVQHPNSGAAPPVGKRLRNNVKSRNCRVTAVAEMIYHNKKKLLLMLSTIAAGVLLLAQRGTPPPEAQPTPSSQPAIPFFGKKLDPEPDWSFVQREADWQNLARLTAPPRDQSNAAAVKLWAKALLTAADPRSQVGEATPGELKQNERVKSLLNAVKSASRETQQPDAESVSKQWLSQFPSNDTKGLSEFWDALEARKVRKAAALKAVLFEWEQKLIGTAHDPPDVAGLREELRPFANMRQQRTAAGSTEIQILVQTDLDRFLRIEKLMNSGGFSDAVADSRYGKSESGTAWKSCTWPERLENLKGLSGDRKLPEPMRELCNKLNNALTR